MNVSFDENKLLLEKYKSGDENAAELLIEKNLGLVKSIALRFTGRGQDIEDLIQIGCMGMLKAIRGYDNSFGTVFSTYAVPLITGEIKRFLRDDGLIKVGRQAKRNGYNLNKCREAFIKRHSREPTINELSQICKISLEEAIYSLEAVMPAYSLQEKISQDSNTEFIDLCSTKDEIDSLCERTALRECLNKLTEYERTLITLRYFKELTQAQTAKIMGITQVKVSRTEKKIIEKLRSQIA